MELDLTLPAQGLRGGELADMVLRKVGDPALAQAAPRVERVDDLIVESSNRMIEVMQDEHGAGLAATQVGLLERMFVYRHSSVSKPKTIINPTIEETGEKRVELEGCLSIPGIMFEVERYDKVLLKGINLDEAEIEIEASDLLSQIFQHEIDHLNGILLTDRLGKDARESSAILSQ